MFHQVEAVAAGTDPHVDSQSASADSGAVVGGDSATLRDLAEIAWDAVRLWPPRYPASILGRPRSWLPPYRRFSEFGIISIWRWRRMVRFLLNVSVPSWPRTPPPLLPPLLRFLFWQPTVILQRPDHIGSYTSFPDETWFLVNGIMTNDAMAQINAAFVSYLFHRPVTLVQNSTDSLSVDILQCMIGKEWKQATEPAVKAFPVIYDALKSPDKRKVVVIAHSQGTIIMANILRLLYAVTTVPAASVAFGLSDYAPAEFIYLDEGELDLEDFPPLSLAELAKLEVYLFATCANELTYFGGAGGRPVPWIEHFGNENDIVARLGMLAPQADERRIDIDGPRFLHAGAWGHLLNEHYLYPLLDQQKRGHRRGGSGCVAPFVRIDDEASDADADSRLLAYINGGRELGADY